jgi:hypothetical protein
MSVYTVPSARAALVHSTVFSARILCTHMYICEIGAYEMKQRVQMHRQNKFDTNFIHLQRVNDNASILIAVHSYKDEQNKYPD